MTGRRSHGRLSALNGVVHQGTTGKNVLRFEQLTETSPFQQHVFSLLGLTP